jgi:predicted oxidoreductase
MQQFSKHVESGLTAFDMADHYGDAEILFVGLSFHYDNIECI